MKSAIDKYVIDQVRQRRKALGVTQRGVAEILDYSDSFVGQVESSKFTTKYSIHQLYMIARAFDCSVSEFFPPLNDPRFIDVDSAAKVRQ